MPRFSVTTRKITIVVAPDIGAAAGMVDRIENGNMAKPDNAREGGIEVISVQRLED